jgi:excisionase family DNA binding protein
MQQILTMQEAADMLRVSKITLRRWEKQGKIKSIRLNERAHRKYLREEVERLIESWVQK